MFRGIPPDAGGRLGVDPATAGGGLYHLLNAIVVPRPIAWVSSRSPAGVDNLAPHSYFTVSSVEPAVVQFTSVGTKDSLRNVVATGEFVVSVCPDDRAAQVTTTAVDFPADVSEFDAAGLTREPAATVRPPRVAESPVSIECALEGTRSFGAATVVFGRVRWIAVRPEVLRGDRVAIDLLRPLARLAGADYARIGEVFAVRRSTYADWLAERG